MRTQDTLDFVNAIAEAFPDPAHCATDRYGRYIGARNTEPLRKLAVKYQVGASDTVTEQAGKVARAIQAAAQPAHKSVIHDPTVMS